MSFYSKMFLLLVFFVSQGVCEEIDLYAYMEENSSDNYVELKSSGYVGYNAGYYTNLDHNFNELWKVSFASEVVVKIYLSGSGVVEVSSSTLDKNTDIWITMGSTNGPVIRNNYEYPYSPFWKIKQIYVSQSDIDVHGNIAYVHVGAQPGGDQNQHWFMVRHFTDSAQTIKDYANMMLFTVRFVFSESIRINIIHQLNEVSDEVRNRQIANRMGAEIIGGALGLIDMSPNSHVPNASEIVDFFFRADK